MGMPGISPVVSALKMGEDYLEQRNEYLESVVRWHRFAFDLLQDTTELVGNVNDRFSRDAILTAAKEQLSRILEWEAIGFMLVDEEEQDFELEFCSPQEHGDFMQAEIDQLIDSGQFAWALNQSHEMVLKSHGWDCNLILHVMATRSRIRGMFIGVPCKSAGELPDSSLQLISLTLNQITYALESAMLYEMLDLKKENLQQVVRQRTKQLEFQHLHDPLTQLPNRQQAIQSLSKLLEQSDAKGRSLSVIMCNISGFKRINEVYGFSAGDAVIKEFSQRLVDVAETCVYGKRQAMDTHVSRIGNDQFCVIVAGVKDKDRLDEIIVAIKSSMEPCFRVGGEETLLAVTMGYSIYPSNASSADAVFSHAETALYEAKQRGANECVAYSRAMHKRAQRDLRAATVFGDAMRKSSVACLFAPQVDLFNQSVLAIQSTARWQPPDDATLDNGSLLAFVHKAGLGCVFSEYVLTKCAEALNQLKAAGFNNTPVLLDISSSYFRQERLLDSILNVLSTFGVEPKLIEISVPESVLCEDMDFAGQQLSTLAEHGIKVWARDVGVGQLSLQYLKEMPVHGLVIARELASGLATNRDDTAIVKALVDLGHHFGVVVSLPSVDTEQQLEAIEPTGCDRGQGFFFGQPQEIFSLIESLENKK